jgi:hypothetical protein
LEGPNLMAVAVGIGSAFTFEPPKRLFESTYQRSQPPSYDVAADGRFLMIKPDSQSGSAVSVIFNWQEQLRQRSATH